jgi:UDP-3-O-[3-hydroxymyristoyl] N-acetylglucosamine deacetylase
MYHNQRTLLKPAQCSGVGVHSGKKVNLTIKPAPANHGVKFVRTDLPGKPDVPALFNMVVDTSLATVIGQEGAIVSTIEHMMASLAGLSIENAIVELDAYEMPIMDGSAGVFTDMIKEAGIKTLEMPRYYFIINEPIELEEDGKFVGMYPSPTIKLSCSIEYDHPLIQKQEYEVELTDESFEKEISRARTFGFLHEIEYLKRYGLARGATLETGIAIDKDEIMNKEGLRYKDEFVRHKILDCIGDFSLLGIPILGRIVAHKSGHAFNQAFLKKFFSEKGAWETRPINEKSKPEHGQSKSLAI